jgi:DNA/RNA-binding domain of Phe-tRNA-synthetase-like protein
MLRHGRYKPTGRGKPASEFLLTAALGGTFPLLHPAANVNNYVSLLSGLPASIFDAATTGPALLARWGATGEQYVFNPSGQKIDLQDLLCICRMENGAWVPTGNPVKDAMYSKLTRRTTDVIAVIYAPPAFSPEALAAHGATFARLLKEWCGAGETAATLTGPSGFSSISPQR